VDKINVAEKLSRIADHWNPRVVAELNGQQVKLVKLAGPFVWHKHDHEDELFFVLRGVLTMELRDRTEHIGPGEMIVIPRGVEHRPVAEAEVECMLFEPATTLNTGDAVGDARTRTVLEHL
jgi:mannose-6-phosphate isomerase-like protein (cupin superfamily)